MWDNGFIKYNKKEKTFIIFDRFRTMIYDSRFDLLDLKALSLKDELERDEINKLTDYIKPLLNNATYRNTITINNYQFYIKKLLTSRVIKIQNDVLTKETTLPNASKVVSYVGGIVGTSFMLYN